MLNSHASAVSILSIFTRVMIFFMELLSGHINENPYTEANLFYGVRGDLFCGQGGFQKGTPEVTRIYPIGKEQTPKEDGSGDRGSRVL